MSSGRLPSGSEYDDALADPQFAFRSEVLRKAEFLPKATGIGGFIHASGNFNVVARAKFEGKEWSVRLPIMDIGSTIGHYGALPSLLGRIRSFAREVRVFDAEIRVSEDSDDRFPIVATEWFHGDRLSEYVRKCCANDDKDALNALRQSLRRLSATLHQVGVAHGDVTGENILVGSGPDDQITVKLIDYDSMWSSDEPFASRLSPVGVNELQHPRQGNPIGPHADKVAFMLIDVALGLLASKPSIGLDENLFDGRRFVFTASEVRERNSPLLGLIPPADLPLVEALTDYLDGDPPSPPRSWWDEPEAVGESIRSIAKAEGARISFAASAAHAVFDHRIGQDESLSDDQAAALRSQIARWRAQNNETQLVIQCGEVDTAHLNAALQDSGISRKRLVRGELTPTEFGELVGLIRRASELIDVAETVRGIADRLAVRESFVLAAFKTAQGRSVGPEQAVTLDEANGTTGVAMTWMRQHTEQRLIESLGAVPPLETVLYALRVLAIPYSELQSGALTPDEFQRVQNQIASSRQEPTRTTYGLAQELGFRESVVFAAKPSDHMSEEDEKILRQRLLSWMSKYNRSRLERDLGRRGSPGEILAMLSAVGIGLEDFEHGRMTPAEFKKVKERYAELSVAGVDRPERGRAGRRTITTVSELAEEIGIRKSVVLIAAYTARKAMDGRSVTVKDRTRLVPEISPDQLAREARLNPLHGSSVIDKELVHGVLRGWAERHSRAELERKFGNRGSENELYSMLLSVGIPLVDFERGLMTPAEFETVKVRYAQLPLRKPNSQVPLEKPNSQVPLEKPKRSRIPTVLFLAFLAWVALLFVSPTAFFLVTSYITVFIVELGKVFVFVLQGLGQLVSRLDQELDARGVASVHQEIGAWGLASGVVLGPVALRRLKKTKRVARWIAAFACLLGIVGLLFAVKINVDRVREIFDTERGSEMGSAPPRLGVVSATTEFRSVGSSPLPSSVPLKLQI